MLYQQVLKLMVTQWHPCSAKQALLLAGNTRLIQPLPYISTKVQKQECFGSTSPTSKDHRDAKSLSACVTPESRALVPTSL